MSLFGTILEKLGFGQSSAQAAPQPSTASHPSASLRRQKRSVWSMSPPSLKTWPPNIKKR